MLARLKDYRFGIAYFWLGSSRKSGRYTGWCYISGSGSTLDLFELSCLLVSAQTNGFKPGSLKRILTTGL